MKSPYIISENNEALGGEETPKATKQQNQNKIFQSQMRTFSTQCPHPALLITRCSYLLSKFLHFIWPHSINPYLATDFCYEATFLVNYSTVQTFSEAAWSSHWNISIVCSYYFVLPFLMMMMMMTMIHYSTMLKEWKIKDNTTYL